MQVQTNRVINLQKLFSRKHILQPEKSELQKSKMILSPKEERFKLKDFCNKHGCTFVPS